MKTLFQLFSISAFQLFLAASSPAASWYAATNGVSGNTGSYASPWDLQTALGKTNSILPGDTLWIMPGSYTHSPQGYVNQVNTGWIFKSYLKGTAVDPIWIRSYTNNNWARIDGGQYSTNFAYFANGRPTLAVGDPQIPVYGTYNMFVNLEFYSSSTEGRHAASDSSFPTEITRSDGPSIYSEGSMFINCMFHDLTTGGSTWMSAIGSGFYGCMFWSNGWQGTPSTHGHNIYAEGRTLNANGLTKMIRRCLFSYPYQKNMQVYGSNNAEISHYRMTQNGFSGSSGHGGVLHGTKSGGNANRMQDNQFTDNWGYNVDVAMAYWQDLASSVDLLFANNYFVSANFQNHSWQQCTVTNNYWIDPIPGFSALAFESNCVGKAWDFDRNKYYFTSSSAQAFRFNGFYGPANFTQWKAFTHWDSNSTVTTTFPSGTNYVIALDNAYDTNRAEVIIYNWTLSNFVAVDVSAFNWGVGASCSLRQSQDPLSDLVAATVTSTNTVIVDMRAASHSVAIPYGEVNGALGPTSFPNYGQFWLVKDTDAGQPAPPNFVSTIASFGASGVTITNSPVDVGGLGNGVTAYERTNVSGTVTSLTAPATVPGWNFSKWQRNGVDYSVVRATTFTNSANVTMTAVYVVMTHTVTVASVNPASGADITVSPVSNSGASDGATGFTRLYNDLVIVSLTALNPLPSGNGFQKWQRGGVDYSTTAAITLTNDADRTYTAYYTNFVIPPATTNTVLTFGGRRRAARF